MYAFGREAQKIGRTFSLLLLALAAVRHGKGRLGSDTHIPNCFKMAVVATSLNCANRRLDDAVYIKISLLPIESIEVNSISTVRGEKSFDQSDSLMNAVVTDGFVVIFQRSQHFGDLIRYLQF